MFLFNMYAKINSAFHDFLYFNRVKEPSEDKIYRITNSYCRHLLLFDLLLKKTLNKLGLSWAKLSCQLGFGRTGINILCLILINMN